MAPIRTTLVVIAAALASLGYSQVVQQTPIGQGTSIQTRVLEQNGREVSRGVTVEIARDRDGLRYFYSQAASRQGTWTTVESWTQQDETPVLAIYRYGIGESQVGEIRFQFSGHAVSIWNSTKPQANQVIEFDPNQSLVLSQFNPATVVNEEKPTSHLLVFEPISGSATPHKVDFKGYDNVFEGGIKIGELKRFTVSSKAGGSSIRTQLNGEFVMSTNQINQTMRIVAMTDAERKVGLSVLQRALAAAAR